jgi:hypothetical protein
MMSGWSPQPAGLQEVLETLHNSTRTNEPEVQKAITIVIKPTVSSRILRAERHYFTETRPIHESTGLRRLSGTYHCQHEPRNR